MSISRLVTTGYLQEIECGDNYALLLSDEDSFLMTEYKVMGGHVSDYLCKCSKVLFNGQTELYYFTKGLKSLSDLFYSLTPDVFITVVSNIMESIINIKNNGFLRVSKIDVSINKIMIDPTTLKAKLLYLPTKRQLYSDEYSTLTELRSQLIKVIDNADNLRSDRVDRLAIDLANGTISINRLYESTRITQTTSEEYVPIREKKDVSLREAAINAPNNEVIKPAQSVQPLERSGNQFRMVLISTDPENYIEIPITKSNFTIGKSNGMVDAVLESNKLSRMHCMVSLSQGLYYLFDMGSTNGTYVNGKRINAKDSVPLEKGDIVTLADLEFIVGFQGDAE